MSDHAATAISSAVVFLAAIGLVVGGLFFAEQSEEDLDTMPWIIGTIAAVTSCYVWVTAVIALRRRKDQPPSNDTE